MVDFSLQVLGANSAIPLPGRISSCFVLSYNHAPVLIDCGEGAQLKMSQFHVKRSKLDHIFISHLHGDHIFGLPGLLGSFGLNNRRNLLHLYGPIGLKAFVDASFTATQSSSPFEIVFHELDGTLTHDLGVINGLQVDAFPLEHRIPTLGYKFSEGYVELSMKGSAIDEFNLSIEEIKAAKLGKAVYRNDEVVPQQLITKKPAVPRSFAYCSDTAYNEDIIEFIANVSLLYHEATYLNELVDKARSRGHSTALEAATIATKASVTKLLIGHYSTRYRDLEPLLSEAQRIFLNTDIAREGLEVNII